MPEAQTKTNDVPPWLEEMRRITGLKEQSGSGSNPLIMKGPKYIADKYPHQEQYCDMYTDRQHCLVWSHGCLLYGRGGY